MPCTGPPPNECETLMWTGYRVPACHFSTPFLPRLRRHRRCHLVDLGEVISERLEHPTLALRLLLQLFEMLGEQIANGVGGLELQRQHALRREDPEQHLYAMYELFCTGEALTHPALHPAWDI